MDDSQVTRRYDTIIGCDILSELNIDSCFSDNTIRGNGVTYEGYTAPIKHVSKINFNSSSNWIKGRIFHEEDLLESKHVLDTMWRTHHIIDAHYKKPGLYKFTFESKHLSEYEPTVLHNLLSKYELLFNIMLGNRENKPIYIELQPRA